MRPFSQKTPFGWHDSLIQGDSVRLAWGSDEPSADNERKPLRREAHPPAAVIAPTDDPLRQRLGEELEYARRMLDATGDELSADPIAVSRHGLALQSIDIVGQMLGHIASVIQSSDPAAAVDAIGMCDLRARLRRRGAL